jgi:hypothetical protein
MGVIRVFTKMGGIRWRRVCVDASSYTKFGYWGLAEMLNENSAKYSAVLDLINA